MKKVDSYIRISEIIYNSLHGDMTQEEQEVLDSWLKEEGHMKFFLSLKNTGRVYDDLLELQYLETDKAFGQLQCRMNREKRIRWWAWVSGLAAMVLLAVGVWMWKAGDGRPEASLLVEGQQPAGDQTVLRTAIGEMVVLGDTVNVVDVRQPEFIRQFGVLKAVEREKSPEIRYNVLSTSSRGNISVTLYDSTRVWLNSKSRLRYPEQFDGKAREVYLVGEAYFEVTKDVHTPFIVNTDRGRIEVLGTQFNVNAREGKPCVTTLVEGCVKVRNRLNDSVVIRPGQQVNIRSEGTMVMKVVNPRFYTAWRWNRFAFENESLYRILEELAEWYGCTFEFSHPHLANLHFTTVVPRYDEPAQVLEVLGATGEFAFHETGNHICITNQADIN